MYGRHTAVTKVWYRCLTVVLLGIVTGRRRGHPAQNFLYMTNRADLRMGPTPNNLLPHPLF